MAAQPVDAHPVGDIAPGDEQVASRTDEVRRVEHRLELGEDVTHGLAGLGDAELRVEQFVRELRSRCRRPARSPPEVVLDDRAVGVRLEVPARPGHRRLDDLVADHQQAVAGAGVAEAAGRPVGGAEALPVVDRVRTPDGDVERLQERDERVEFPLGPFDQHPGVLVTGGEPLQPRRPRRDVAGHDRVTGRDRRAVEAAYDDLLQRVPLGVRIDRRSRALLGAGRRGRGGRHPSWSTARARASSSAPSGTPGLRTATAMLDHLRSSTPVFPK